MYDYDKQTEEELSFKEGEQFNVYDLNDPDWLLVGDMAGQNFGFVPANYTESGPANASQPSGGLPSQPPTASSFAPPPVHKDRMPVLAPEPVPELEEVEEAPPPMPTRPTGNQGFTPTRESQLRPVQAQERIEPELPRHDKPKYEEEENVGQEHTFDGEYFRWFIDEVDGRKKRPVVLTIGNGLLILKPNNSKKLSLKSASNLDNNWRIRDMHQYSNEKKHVFLEFHNPEASIELHAGTKDVADAIVAILADLKGAEAAKGLREVARAALTRTSATNRKIGRLIYDFESQGSDELMCREGDEVYIIDESKSKEWWMCERTSDGKQGVVPSAYIEILGTTNLDKLTDGVHRRKSQKGSSKGKVVDTKRKSYYSRDERDKIRESDRTRRDKSKRSDKDDKNLPNYHRVRTWIDSSGSFKVEAEFLGCMEGKIHLHKTNGVKIAVAATKLSIEDLEYVEKVTGTSLQLYKDEVAKQMSRKSKSGSHGSGTSPIKKQHTAVAVINDVPPPQPSRAKATAAMSQSEPDYDWFEFFLSCGVDIGNCQRYSINFSREQMDESILEDITPSLLRSLGLREGDILRVMKFLDSKFDRKKSVSEAPATGGLFTEPTGALKNNSSTEISKVTASALPDPSPLKSKPLPVPEQSANAGNFEDDAWAVKPAARSSEDLSRQPQKPQYTGSLQDLVNIKPLEPNNPQTPVKEVVQQPVQTPAQTMTPVKTGTLIQPNQQFQVQKTGGNNGAPLVLMRTGGYQPMVPVQTGGLIPVRTGGLIPMPTGFAPITAQPTGFMPIQQTGLVPQLTFGIVPLQTGATTFVPQRTGPLSSWEPLAGPPPTTFGQAPMPSTNSFVPMQPTSSFVPLQQGAVTMPQTTFVQQRTGPMGGQATGGTLGNTFVPQSTFGRQITGGVMPQTSFGMQPSFTGGNNAYGQTTGGAMPQTSFGAQPGLAQFTGQPMSQPSLGSYSSPMPTFGTQPMPQFGSSNSMPQTSFGSQTTGGVPQQGSVFGQPTGGYAQPFSSAPNVSQIPFGQNTGYGQPQQFQQPQQNFDPSMNQMTNMFQNTGISPYGQPQQQPNTTFGQQQQFEGFGQPLQAQPTGLGFGNAPMQAQQTGRRANLQAATADNPFGF